MKKEYFVLKWQNVLILVDKSKLIKGIGDSYFYCENDTNMIIYFRSIFNLILVITYVYTPRKMYVLPNYDKVDMDVEADFKYQKIKKTMVSRKFSDKQYIAWKRRRTFEKMLSNLGDCFMPYFGIKITNRKLVKSKKR